MRSRPHATKLAMLSGLKEWPTIFLLSVIVTLANKRCLGTQVCGRGEIALSSQCFTLPCEAA